VKYIDTQTLHLTIPPMSEAGQYIAFVYDKKDPSPPLVIVFVLVSSSAGHEPAAQPTAGNRGKKKRTSKKAKIAKKAGPARKKAAKKG
jgi:hypothetical protein